MKMQGQTDVREAVKTAKECVAELFADEAIKSPRLEEILFDEHKHAWKITISFLRPSAGLIAAMATQRTYKVVQIDDLRGHVISMTHRTVAASN